jgi:hypothetical protein
MTISAARVCDLKPIFYERQYTEKTVIVFTRPQPDVTNQTLPGWE